MSTQPDTESELDADDPRQWRKQPRDEDLGYETTDWQRVECDDGKYRFLPEGYEAGGKHPIVSADKSAVVDLAEHA